MYIEQNDTKYPCAGYDDNGGNILLVLPDKPVLSGVVTLCVDNGFELRKINCADYARQVWSGETLTLTNEPEPEPRPQPEPEPDRITTDDLAEQVFDLEVRTTILEQREQGVN